MNKTIKIIIASVLFSVLGSAFSVSYAQDAEYNLIRRHYSIYSDGTMDIHYRKEIKLLRNRAITAYADKGETFILYNPAIDRLTINESYTIRPDGSRVQTPDNAFVDQLPSQCENCGRYNGIRERAVIHTALEYDCIIVLDYTIKRKTDYLEESIVFAEDCPVKRYEVIVDVPKDREIEIVKTNFDKEPKAINDGHTFHIVVNDLSQTIIDNYLPNDLYPTLSITYGMDAYKILEMAWETLPEANDVLGELYDKDPLSYATNIRDYVADYIRTTDFPLSLIGYDVSSAKTTFLSNCGTPRDKDWLTVIMLRQAGFTAEDKESDGRISVDIEENGVSLTYILSTRNKRPARLEGLAIEEQRNIEISRTLDWTGSNIGGGYSEMVIPTEHGSISIDPAMLTSVRTAPLKVRNCNERYHYTVVAPRNAALVKPVSISYTKSGIGSIKIVLRQLDNGNIDVVRELDIDVADGIVTKKQYKAFRKMMQDWSTYNKLTIKAK